MARAHAPPGPTLSPDAPPAAVEGGAADEPLAGFPVPAAKRGASLEHMQRHKSPRLHRSDSERGGAADGGEGMGVEMDVCSQGEEGSVDCVSDHLEPETSEAGERGTAQLEEEEEEREMGGREDEEEEWEEEASSGAGGTASGYATPMPAGSELGTGTGADTDADDESEGCHRVTATTASPSEPAQTAAMESMRAVVTHTLGEDGRLLAALSEQLRANISAPLSQPPPTCILAIIQATAQLRQAVQRWSSAFQAAATLARSVSAHNQQMGLSQRQLGDMVLQGMHMLQLLHAVRAYSAGPLRGLGEAVEGEVGCLQHLLGSLPLEHLGQALRAQLRRLGASPASPGGDEGNSSAVGQDSLGHLKHSHTHEYSYYTHTSDLQLMRGRGRGEGGDGGLTEQERHDVTSMQQAEDDLKALTSAANAHHQNETLDSNNLGVLDLLQQEIELTAADMAAFAHPSSLGGAELGEGGCAEGGDVGGSKGSNWLVSMLQAASRGGAGGQGRGAVTGGGGSRRGWAPKPGSAANAGLRGKPDIQPGFQVCMGCRVVCGGVGSEAGMASGFSSAPGRRHT